MSEISSDCAIRVQNLVKDFEVYAKPIDLALEVITRRTRHTVFRALDDVTFDVKRGEVLGIIGSNGAGKSTLLKIITGVLDASSGSVDIAGRVTAILELGLGFNPEYSGRDNIYLSGLLYGMDKAEIDRKLDAIIAFSGLGDFIERPVKNYSSGMHARLAFSIATAVDPDILIIDEALAAGDAGFVQKCLRRIRELCSGGRTILLVSHGTGLLAQLCQRVVWIEKGQMRMIGPAIQVVQAYDLAAHQNNDTNSWIETIEDDLAVQDPQDETNITDTLEDGTIKPIHNAVEVSRAHDFRQIMAQQSDTGRQVFRRGPVFIDRVEMLDEHGNTTNRLTLLKPFKLRIHYRVEGSINGVTLGVALSVNNKHDLSPVAQFYTQNIRPTETRETYALAHDRFMAEPQGTLVLSFDTTPFRKGDYILSLGLLPNEPATWEFYEYRHFYYPFSVDDAGMDVGAPMFIHPILTHEFPKKAEAFDLISQEDEGVEDQNPPLYTTLRREIEAVCSVEGDATQSWQHHAACPACGSNTLKKLFYKYNFRHDQCANCGFVCLNPYPPEDVLNALYAGEYYSRIREYFELPLAQNGGESTPFSAPKEALIDVIHRVTLDIEQGSWLDVGGGIGTFCQLITGYKPEWTIKLNELNPQSIKIAKELFDFEVVTGSALELFEQGQQFDVVSSIAVMEHIPDPRSFIEGYVKLIKSGGWLITIVPHFTHLNAAVSHGSSPNVIPPFHTSLFNEGALRTFFERIPDLELVSIDQAGGAAFSLLHHVDYGDHWDVTMPTLLKPVPQSLQIIPYIAEQSDALNALGVADLSLSDYFAAQDGRALLIAYCRKK